jgi:hypothetical protein
VALATATVLAAAAGARRGQTAFGRLWDSTLPATLALSAFLALLAIGAVGHALSIAVRRRRHELAVLRALGGGAPPPT